MRRRLAPWTLRAQVLTPENLHGRKAVNRDRFLFGQDMVEYGARTPSQPKEGFPSDLAQGEGVEPDIDCVKHVIEHHGVMLARAGAPQKRISAARHLRDDKAPRLVQSLIVPATRGVDDERPRYMHPRR